jgi:hypothetical protein
MANRDLMYLSETVDVRDCDGARAALDVWISEGESDPGETILEYLAPGDYALIRLDLEAACHLWNVLNRMINAHGDIERAS